MKPTIFLATFLSLVVCQVQGIFKFETKYAYAQNNRISNDPYYYMTVTLQDNTTRALDQVLKRYKENPDTYEYKTEVEAKLPEWKKDCIKILPATKRETINNRNENMCCMDPECGHNKYVKECISEINSLLNPFEIKNINANEPPSDEKPYTTFKVNTTPKIERDQLILSVDEFSSTRRPPSIEKSYEQYKKISYNNASIKTCTVKADDITQYEHDTSKLKIRTKECYVLVSKQQFSQLFEAGQLLATTKINGTKTKLLLVLSDETRNTIYIINDKKEDIKKNVYKEINIFDRLNLNNDETKLKPKICIADNSIHKIYPEEDNVEVKLSKEAKTTVALIKEIKYLYAYGQETTSHEYQAINLTSFLNGKITVENILLSDTEFLKLLETECNERRLFIRETKSEKVEILSILDNNKEERVATFNKNDLEGKFDNKKQEEQHIFIADDGFLYQVNKKKPEVPLKEKTDDTAINQEKRSIFKWFAWPLQNKTRFAFTTVGLCALGAFIYFKKPALSFMNFNWVKNINKFF